MRWPFTVVFLFDQRVVNALLWLTLLDTFFFLAQGRPWFLVLAQGRPWFLVLAHGRPWTLVLAQAPPWFLVLAQGANDLIGSAVYATDGLGHELRAAKLACVEAPCEPTCAGPALRDGGVLTQMQIGSTPMKRIRQAVCAVSGGSVCWTGIWLIGCGARFSRACVLLC